MTCQCPRHCLLASLPQWILCTVAVFFPFVFSRVWVWLRIIVTIINAIDYAQRLWSVWCRWWMVLCFFFNTSQTSLSSFRVGNCLPLCIRRLRRPWLPRLKPLVGSLCAVCVSWRLSCRSEVCFLRLAAWRMIIAFLPYFSSPEHDGLAEWWCMNWGIWVWVWFLLVYLSGSWGSVLGIFLLRLP